MIPGDTLCIFISASLMRLLLHISKVAVQFLTALVMQLAQSH